MIYDPKVAAFRLEGRSSSGAQAKIGSICRADEMPKVYLVAGFAIFWGKCAAGLKSGFGTTGGSYTNRQFE